MEKLGTKPLATLPLFLTGVIVMTPGAIAAMTRNSIEPMALIDRHVHLDPGTLDPEDRAANREAVGRPLRIFSEYALPVDATKVWVITEADRSVTTILLPEDY